MYSRAVSVSAFHNYKNLTDAVLNNGASEPQNWIVIKWFHHTDFDTQEELNDASEIFADEILRDLSRWHFLKIENVKLKEVNGHFTGHDFDVETIIHKTK